MCGLWAKKWITNTIVEQILTFARNAEPSLKPTDINKLIDDLRFSFAEKWPSKMSS